MRRFRILFVVFALALLGPVAVLVSRAAKSVALERQAGHRALAERVFDEMERSLSGLLAREDERPLEAYDASADSPDLPFLVGHFEVDPDGGVSIPRTERAAEITAALGQQERAARDTARTASLAEGQIPGTTVLADELRRPQPSPSAPVMHRYSVRGEREQNALEDKQEVSAYDAFRALNKGAALRERQKLAAAVEPAEKAAREKDAQRGRLDLERPAMNGRVVDATHLVLHRTVVRGRQAFRQGLVVDLTALGTWLREQGLGDEGLAAYADVAFVTPFSAPAPPPATSAFVYRHRFAEPFEDVSARLALRPLPGIGDATYVYALSGLLLAVALLGLAALYRMVVVVVSFAERRSSFVAAVSHELKTPLTAIRMYGEMLRDGMVASEAKRNEYYRHITVESERLGRLINNVLEFSRLENGSRQVTLVTGSVAPVVREVVDLVRPHVEGEGFALQVDVEDGLPAVRFEPDGVMQVLFNLVDNAVKYARDASARVIGVSCRRAADGVRLTVRDHGPGVPSRQLGRIFEPFYRVENELTRRSKGTGLGLALVRGIVERMGGRVTGRNVPEGGFEVEVALGVGG